MSGALSVVLPTRNRREKLGRALDALLGSPGAEALGEVVVVDDGSDDDTPAWLDARMREEPRLRALRTPGRGPAYARNRGVERVTRPFVLFLQDDVVLDREALGRFLAHVRRHDMSKASVFGNVRPTPRDLTAFEWWNANGGSQFTQVRVRDPFDAGHEYYYTTNVVSPTALLRADPFDESFPYARYEDRELGYRLERRRGHRIHYRADAGCEHDHKTPFATWLDQADRFAWSAVHFAALYPEDSALRAALGIDRAEALQGFDAEALLAAADLLNRFAPRFFDPPERYGQGWLRQVVGESFRTIQCFFRSDALRRHAGGAPLLGARGESAAEVAAALRARLDPGL